MYPLRLFSKLASPKRLAYEDHRNDMDGMVSGDGDQEDGEESSVSMPSQMELATFVTTRRDPGLDLSPPRPINGQLVVEFDPSPPKTIQRGRKRNPGQSEGVVETAAARSEQSATLPNTPGRPAKRKTKLTWQSRPGPETPSKNVISGSNANHRRSPSLTRVQSDNSRLDNYNVAEPAISRNLQQSSSFSGVSGSVKEERLNNGRSNNHPQSSRDNVGISTPRGSRGGNSCRPPMNAELTSSITSLGSVTSVATPRSAARRHAGSSRARMVVQQQQSAQVAIEEVRFDLEEDPTFWQDHNVQVLIRTRPISNSEIAQQGYARCVRQENAHTIAWLGQPESRFTFDHVAGESISQEELFRVAGLPMVDNCMAGYNSCMFAYGQTGSGKTHTMLGDIADLDHLPSENRGMTPRVFETLFAKIQVEEEAQKHEKLKFKCRCSFLEIYNEQITDLLEPSSSNLQMREDATKGVYVEGLLEVEVQNVQDVLHLLLLGAANRRVAATNMNRESSRSHSVFTCIIESQWECDAMINFRFGRLNLVDLAGSERQKASGAEGERLKEAASINKSLSTLGLVIMILVDVANGKQRHVPYRDSKLTFLLQDSLGGNSKTTIIANISPSSCASLESLSTLKFAQRAKFIQNNAVVNEDAAGDVNALRQQIQQLKDELARLRRQSISRIPTMRASGSRREGVISEDCPSSSQDGLDAPICETEGSFLQFAKAVLSPTVLNKKIKALEAVLAGALRREQAAESLFKRSAVEIDHLKRLVKQRDNETHHSMAILKLREDRIRRLEALSEGMVTADTCLIEEKNAALEELELVRSQKSCNPELTKYAMEQCVRFEDSAVAGDREAMAQEISNLRDQLVEVLDGKLSLDCLAHCQKDASSAKHAAEGKQLELLRIEVGSFSRELEDCRSNLRKCLECNEDLSSKLAEVQTDLECSNEECKKQKQDIEILEEKALDVDYLELKEAQHQQFISDLKNQLRKSDERAELEAGKRIQLEHELKEALQESSDLQTELQWTKDSLDAAELLVESLQQNDLSSEVGMGQCREVGLSQALVIEQLQLDLAKMKETLDDERTRGRGLEEQIAGHGKNAHQRAESTESYDSAGHTRVRHHDAILQLQMELDSIDGAPESAIKSYRWEEGTCHENVEAKADVENSVTIMQLQLDLEAAESSLAESQKHLQELELSNATIQQQLDETVSKLKAETALVEALKDHHNLDVASVLERETAAKQDVSRLSQELASVNAELNLVQEEYDGLLKEKDAEVRALQRDWEGAAARLVDHLAAGKLSVDGALSSAAEVVFSNSLSQEGKFATDEIFLEVIEEQKGVEALKRQLRDARVFASSSEKRVQDLSDVMSDEACLCRNHNLDENDRDTRLQAHLNMKELKSQVQSCDANLREIERKCTDAFIMVWWLSETATLRYVAEDTLKVELTEAVAKIQEREGVLFSLKLEREKTPEKDSPHMQRETIRMHKELAFWEEERLQLAAKKERFEIQVKEIATILRHLQIDLTTAEGRLQQVDAKAAEMATAQSGLAVTKENWLLEKSVLEAAAAESELRYKHIEQELHATQEIFQTLKIQTQEAEAREDAVQAERTKLEEELKKHLEAVHVLAEALQSQIEVKEQEILKLKEQMAEQYEDWVLERSDLLVANRELEARCLERSHANMSRTVEAFQGHILSTGYNSQTLECKMYEGKLLPNDEAWLQMKERGEEMATIIDNLNAENLDLQREKQFLGDDMENARRYIAQKEEEFAVAKDRMENAEKNCKQVSAKLEELTVLMDQFASSERNWLSERESLQTEIGRLQLCMSSMEVEFHSGHNQRNECSNRLDAAQQKMETGALSANGTITKVSKNKEIELANTRAVLAGSEEKVKLLSEMVATMGEDWAAERERLIAEKEELQNEVSRLEQHSDVRRSSDQPLRNLSENRSLPAVDGSTNTKYVDKLRQDVERMRNEIVKLRTKVREKDNAILGLQMELSAAVAGSKELKSDTEKLVFERDQLLQTESELRAKLMTAGGNLKRHEDHVQKCESELERLTMMLLETEERMDQDQQKWMEEKAQLETAREEAELLANEKKNEAAAMLVKFEEWKTTLREADSLVNALVQVNEKAKQRWKREKERLAISQAEETNQVVEEMLETVGVTQDQVDKTMSHIEGEMRALVVETQILKMEMTTELLKLKREKPGSMDEMSRSIEILPSLKCLDIERRSWEQQFKASLTILSEKEAALQSVQAEIEKSRKQTAIAQRGHNQALKLLQEKEEVILKLSSELNHLSQNANRDRALRQSLTRDLDAHTSLRRSFSCKLIEEKDTTLSVLKEEQEELKTMVFGLEAQNAELQEQLMEAEAKVASLESTLGNFQAKIQESNDLQDEEVRILAGQLKESAQHISDLECHRLELREEMQRQAIAFAELYEQLQQQECDLEGEARTIASKVAEEKEVLRTLEEEKAQLKYMVERLDAELTVYEEKATSTESSMAELERLRLEMEGLQEELQKIESLQEKIDAQNTMLDALSQQRAQLEENLESKNQELIVLGEELEAMKISADSAIQESEKLRDQVEQLQMKAFALEEDLVRKRASIKLLEAELNRVEETMARCLEEATVDLKELETERDKLQSDILILSDQLDLTQAHADERAAAAVEAQQTAEQSKTIAEEKQVEVDILGRSVEELESTVYALESQLGILKRESERQRLMREDMEMEFQGLKNHMSIMQAALDEAGARSADDLFEAQSAREDAERRLEEKEAEMELVQKKLEKLQNDSEDKTEKIQHSKIQISDLLAEAAKKAAEYDDKLKAVETKLEERVNTQSTIPRGPKLKGTGSTFKCIGMGHQVDAEWDQERDSYERRIEELETELGLQQKEVYMLNGKLAGAEQMTRDVLSDLLGVKSDMTNVVTLLGQQEEYPERSERAAIEKDEEVEHVMLQLNGLIEERESWLEEISRRQADLLTTQAAADKLQECVHKLTAENAVLKSETRLQQKKIGDLELEIKKLSGQQNLQQRIKHHAKIKDENNLLRIQNDELSGKLRRAELLYTRVCDELAKYRTAEGKLPLMNIDEEQLLRNKLTEVEAENLQVSQKLSSMCTSIIKAAGIFDTDSSTEPSVALEALRQLKSGLEATKFELEDCKLQMRIIGEKQRLNELRNVHSPMKGIGNFSAQCLVPR